MGDMAYTDVTVTLDQRDVDFLAMATKVTFPSIAFGASSGKAYPTGGIPMPPMGAFGMKKEIRRIFISPRAADGIMWKYDRVNHKIMAYVVGGAVTGTIANATSTGNLAQANVAIAAGTGNLSSNALGGNTANGTGYINDKTLAVDARAATANTANVANRALAMEAHSHSFTGGDVTDAAMAEYANADMVAKVLDLMVIGS